jgi:inorganic pyrophosphatase
MSLKDINAGNNLPHEFNVVIEIAMNSDPVKYEVDKDTGLLKVDRFVGTSMHYPCNYGYIPKTLSKDGDPLDVMLLTPFPLIPGCLIECRAVGVLHMSDEAGEDAKLLAVPTNKVFPTYSYLKNINDVNDYTLSQLVHFFKHYKDLEPNKSVDIKGWGNIDDAEREITESVENYQITLLQQSRPNFKM